jgi:hypothetical protein
MTNLDALFGRIRLQILKGMIHGRRGRTDTGFRRCSPVKTGTESAFYPGKREAAEMRLSS